MPKPRKKTFKEIIIGKIAERMVVVIDEPPLIAEKKKELKNSRVAFITTSGVHTKEDVPFNTDGDHTYRMVPGDVDFDELMITHTHYDTSEAEKDKNVVFPLEILRSLARQGHIRDVAPRNFSFMGYIPEVRRLIEESAPAIADMLVEDGVDIALLSPG